MKKITKILTATLLGLLIPIVTFASPVSVNRLLNNHIEPLVTTDFFQAAYLKATSTTASTLTGGLLTNTINPIGNSNLTIGGANAGNIVIMQSNSDTSSITLDSVTEDINFLSANGVVSFTSVANGVIAGSFSASSITDSGLSSGKCVQAGVGGLLATLSSACSILTGGGANGNVTLWNTASQLGNDPDFTWASASGKITIGVSNIGTTNSTTTNLGITGLTQGWLSTSGLSGASITSSTSPTVNYIFATSTSKASTFPYASSTALSVSSLTSGNCVQASTGGLLTTVASACGSGSGGGSFPFSADTNYGVQVYSTSTPSLWLKSGLYASSTSQIAYASSTDISVTSGVTYIGRTALDKSRIYTTQDPGSGSVDALIIEPPQGGNRVYIGTNAKQPYSFNLQYVPNGIEGLTNLNATGYVGNSNGSWYMNGAGNVTTINSYYGQALRPNQGGSLVTTPQNLEGTDANGVEIQSAITTAVTLAVYGKASQTADLMNFKNSSFTKLAVVNNFGWLGIGSSTPKSKLSIQATSTTDNSVLLTLASSTNVVLFSVDKHGHIATGGTAPTISSCGSGPNGSVVGDDTSGTVTVGGGVVTACTLTFAAARAVAPRVVGCTANSALACGATAKSATAVTFGFSATLGGGTFDYLILGQ